jgi:hypothetical protein
MALVNACWFRATTGGTGSFEVASAITGYMTPAQADAEDAATYGYRAESDDNSQWEIGEGVYTASGTLLSRSVLKSSNSNSLVNFSAAPRVMLTPLASDFGGGGGGAWEVVPGGSGTVTTPVTGINIDLPTGYRMFRLTLLAFESDSDAWFQLFLSSDGGATFHGDEDNYDSYKNVQLEANAVFDDATGYVFHTANPILADTPASAVLHINPGSTGRNAHIMTSSIFVGGNLESLGRGALSILLTEETGRQNAIRISINYLSSQTQDITAGSYVLEGWPE